MTSINQILNSALMETVELKEGLEPQSMYELDAKKEDSGLRDELASKTTPTQANTDADKDKPAHSSAAPGSFDWATAGKYGGAGLAALGAGLGAVALAKKLRAKKSAAKAKK